jgi:putative PIN family toxin of toxin-antitoxin system
VKGVFDTNIFISAFAIPGGKAEEAYLAAVSGEFELYTSVALLTETANTLQSKFEWSDEKIRQALENIYQIARVLKTEPSLSVVEDEPDNRVLECALAAHADVVVTGDRHLLVLKVYERTGILSLATFLHELRGKTTA